MQRLTWFAAEAPRFAMQMGKTLLELPARHTLPEGDGHPVIFLPGFSTGNGATFFMRRVLEERGHHALKWAHGHNLGIEEEMVGNITNQIARLAEESGEAVSLVGQSLGGSVARVLANKMPEMVRCVVTLGSPLNSLGDVLDHVKTMYDAKTTGTLGAQEAWDVYGPMIEDNPPVPSTSIYSKTDGVVGWRESLQPESDIAENVEVCSSHLSMGFDIDVIKVIADRLSQPTEGWKKYEH